MPSNIDTKRLIIITGLAGAGKSTASKALEDAGYYCIDNLPAFLLNPLLTTPDKLAGREKIALVMDGRDPEFLHGYQQILEELKVSKFTVTILFLEADDSVLLRRFSEMRRRHPFSTNSVRNGIDAEKKQLGAIRDQADIIINSSNLTPHALKEQLVQKIQGKQALQICVVSFGFKRGAPTEADLLLDVRFLPNPYFVTKLRSLTGLEPEISSYVLDNPISKEFLDKLEPLLIFLVPQYRQEGKAYLTIGIGCTGGKHRSVAIAEKISQTLRNCGENVSISHRDLGAE